MDGTFVGDVATSVSAIPVENEVLLVDASGAVRIPLNPTASLIWQCLDGVSTLGDIAFDLAEGFDIPVETALADVVTTVNGFVEAGVAYDARDSPPELVNSEPRPRPLRDDDFALGDAGRISIRVTDSIVGIRSNDRDTMELLRSVLASAVVTAQGPTRVSVVATPDRGRIPGMHFVHVDEDLVFRSLSRERAVRAAIELVDVCAPTASDEIRLDSHLLVRDGEATLVGGAFREMLDLAEPRLARRGWRTGAVPRTVVGRADHRVHVRPNAVPIDDDALTALEAAVPQHERLAVPPGDYPIARVLLVGSEPEADKLATPAQRLAALLPILSGWSTHRLDVDDVTWLSNLCGVETAWIFGFDERELFDRLEGRAPWAARPPRR